MHVVFLTNEYPTENESWGGIGTFVNCLANALVKRGIKVSVVGFYHNHTGVSNEAGVDVHRLPYAKRGLNFIKNAIRLNKALGEINRQSRIDIVEGSELSLAFVRKRKGIKYVIRMHGGHTFFAKAEGRQTVLRQHIQEVLSFKKADGLVAVSNFVAKTTRSLLKIKDEIKVIYNPIGIDNFYYADATLARKNRLIFVGTIVEKKGIRQLIEAMPLIASEVPDVELFVVGRPGTVPGSNLDYFPILKKSIPTHLQDRIIFKGGIPNSQIPLMLETAELCVYPSHMEAMPLSWIEALAMGKPFVGSTTGPGNEIILNGQTGLLANPFDPKNIAEKVIWMLQNKKEAVEMGRQARADIEQRFNIQKLVEDNIQFYSDVSTKGKVQ